MNEATLDQEVRIRLLEKIASSIDKRFDKLEAKMDSQFHWVLATILMLIVATISLLAK